MRSLKDKVIVITGGSKGLGLVLARQLLEEDCKLRSKEELQLAQENIGKNVFIKTCDVARREEVDEFLLAVIRHYGQIDVLINDAGIMMAGALESYTSKEYQDSMNIMFWGIMNTTYAILPHFKERGEGQIINITSIGGMVPVPHMLPYVSAKFAAVGFSQGCTAELRKDNIFVTTIVPGLMRTGSYTNAFFQDQNKQEFKLFAALSTAPVITISAEKAARKIIRAIKNRDVMQVLGIPAKILLTLDHLFPATMVRAYGLASRFIPSRKEVSHFVTGEEIQREFKDSEVPILKDIGESVHSRNQPQH
jgi:short-subunit dehydrogenase